jgi:hypothetical protein
MMEVLLFSVEEARVTPKWTVDEEENPVPVIVTAVPPAAGPKVGEIFVTVGSVSAEAL